MKHTQEKASPFGLALVSWLMGCAALAYESE
jgi:hypothetical protein